MTPETTKTNAAAAGRFTASIIAFAIGTMPAAYVAYTGHAPTWTRILLGTCVIAWFLGTLYRADKKGA